MVIDKSKESKLCFGEVRIGKEEDNERKLTKKAKSRKIRMGRF